MHCILCDFLSKVCPFTYLSLRSYNLVVLDQLPAKWDWKAYDLNKWLITKHCEGLLGKRKKKSWQDSWKSQGSKQMLKFLCCCIGSWDYTELKKMFLPFKVIPIVADYYSWPASGELLHATQGEHGFSFMLWPAGSVSFGNHCCFLLETKWLK